MSMMRCDGCDGLIDTDEDVEGLREDAKPFRFFCSRCVENLDETAMSVMKKQDPDLHKELTS